MQLLPHNANKRTSVIVERRLATPSKHDSKRPLARDSSTRAESTCATVPWHDPPTQSTFATNLKYRPLPLNDVTSLSWQKPAVGDMQLLPHNTDERTTVIVEQPFEKSYASRRLWAFAYQNGVARVTDR